MVRWVRHWRRLSAPTLSMASFALLIALGTAGLMWIPGLQAGPALGLIDAWFTATSAVCVTGLTVVDTATHFAFWGQLWLIVLIQLGGIGIITLGTMIIGALGTRLSLRSEMLTMMPTWQGDRPAVWQVALAVLKFSIVVEGIGAVALFSIWVFDHPIEEAAWHAVFHAISAYCNAGFSTFSDSLIGERALVLGVVSLLIVLGGLGYLVFAEIARWWRSAGAGRVGARVRVRAPHRLSSHTWAVLVTTLALLVVGWVLFAVFEWHGQLEGMSLIDRIANAWFMAVTSRTAGFNAVDYAQVGNDTAALTIMLMFVGGSPGSTAGGVKTTIAVLVALAMSRMRGLKFVGLEARAIPQGTIERAVGILLLAMLVLTVAFFLLNAIESVPG
jgi:trk system potassium uptake protein TrkH